MATFAFTSSSPLTLTKPKQPNHHHHHRNRTATISTHPPRRRSATLQVRAYKVVIEHDGAATELEVDPDETILSKALDSGVSVPYDCQLGVCMTCPAKVLTGSVDQSDGMLSDDVVERGYALLCASYPRSDCTIRTIPEDELLSLQLVTTND